ncbi:MAG: Omp28-related outer membrane protein, partial [Flavobacteriales bacterium]|nr:Omp28-related outer membrane protein [Flavobacteriales bacterium]
YPASQAPSFQYDFRTQWGDNWDDFYGISAMGLPRGMVNRIGYPDNHKLSKDEWATEVTNELNKEVDFGIDINTTINSITISSNVLNNVNGDYNLVVCLTESNIINWQKDGQENVENYIHNHVLKSVLTDENLSNSTSYIAGEQIETLINYDLATLEQSNMDYSTNTAELGNGNAGDWNASNMSIIAYIYNTTTKEIMQAEEAYLNE